MSGSAGAAAEEQQWLDEVVTAELGEPVVASPSWRTWLRELFSTEGALRGPELRKRVEAAQLRVAEAACGSRATAP